LAGSSRVGRWFLVSLLIGAPFLVFPRLDLEVAARALGHCNRHEDQHPLLRTLHEVVLPLLVAAVACTRRCTAS